MKENNQKELSMHEQMMLGQAQALAVQSMSKDLPRILFPSAVSDGNNQGYTSVDLAISWKYDGNLMKIPWDTTRMIPDKT